MKINIKSVLTVLLVVFAVGMLLKPVKAYAGELDGTQVEASVDDPTSAKAMSAAIMIAVASGLGALSMGFVIAKTIDGIARQPEAEGKMRTGMMLGLVFIETAIIYALIVAILIIFVL
ncbi:MAG: ATP synthase F0 subunit C [Lachnospiraceae bacterium]|nr:ATP synthase F0 subunit C [Lachnospiraceae bacterium]